MEKLKTKPILFILLLFFISLILSGILGGVLNLIIGNSNVSGAISRIIIGILLFIFFYNKNNLKYSFNGFVLMLPLLLLGLYKIPLHFYSNGQISNILIGFICGLSPGIYEEVIFRGIFIDELNKKYDNKFKILLISSIIFCLVHLTNYIGLDIITLIIQLIFSFVCGLAFAGVYLNTNDICSLIIAHAFIDIIGYIFLCNSVSSYLVIILFILILAIESLYGIILTKNINKDVK